MTDYAVKLIDGLIGQLNRLNSFTWPTIKDRSINATYVYPSIRKRIYYTCTRVRFRTHHVCTREKVCGILYRSRSVSINSVAIASTLGTHRLHVKHLMSSVIIPWAISSTKGINYVARYYGLTRVHSTPPAFWRILDFGIITWPTFR